MREKALAFPNHGQCPRNLGIYKGNGYQTEELPAFYTRKSGFSVDYRVDSPAELAEIFTTQQQIVLLLL